MKHWNGREEDRIAHVHESFIIQIEEKLRFFRLFLFSHSFRLMPLTFLSQFQLGGNHETN